MLFDLIRYNAIVISLFWSNARFSEFFNTYIFKRDYTLFSNRFKLYLPVLMSQFNKITNQKVQPVLLKTTNTLFLIG